MGNLIWRTSRSAPETDVMPSWIEVWNHFHGRIAAKQEERIVGSAALEDDRHEDDVDGHLEERVEHPPQVAEERVGALLVQVRLDQVSDQPPSTEDLDDCFAQRARAGRDGRHCSENGWGLPRSDPSAAEGNTGCPCSPCGTLRRRPWSAHRPCRPPRRGASRCSPIPTTRRIRGSGARPRRSPRRVTTSRSSPSAVRRPRAGDHRRGRRPPARRPAPPGRSLPIYLREYLSFFVRSGVALARAHARRRFALVQVHTLPDFLVFATVPLRLTGVPVILDLHEAMPEFFGSRFRGRSRRDRALAAPGCRSGSRCRYASAVVTVNDALADRLLELGVPACQALDRPERAIPRAVLGRRVSTRARSWSTGRSGSSMPGRSARSTSSTSSSTPWPGCASATPASTSASTSTAATSRRCRCATRPPGWASRTASTFHGRIPVDEVPAAIAAADIGLAPTRRSAFTDYSLSTKAFEYAAMARPVVASRLPMVERIVRRRRRDVRAR